MFFLQSNLEKRVIIIQIYFPGIRIPSYLTWNHFWASSLLNLCGAPIRLWHRRRRAILWPGRSRTTKQSMLEKLPFLSSYSLTFKPDSRISSAFGPRTVTRQAIFSFLLIPKDRTVNRAFE